MSLSLLQGYSSGEEGGEAAEGYRIPADDEDDSSSSLSGEEPRPRGTERSIFDHARTSSNSLLPSAFDVFDKVAGPPAFLNSSAGEGEAREVARKDTDRSWRRRGPKAARDKKDLPTGVVIESKAQLVGIRDRVRSDEGSGPNGSANKISGDAPRVVSATNPEPKDAAELLRMCIQCGIPKTYSHNRGMVCPVCSDRPPADPNSAAEKKKGSAIKDKEKSKRMKGQSSHATWKSETEMQLRQQFD